jgi:hypothetical protein
MDERFEQLRAVFPEFGGNFTPSWGLPTEEDFAVLAIRTGCRFPPSFIRFQTHYAAVLRFPDNGLRWANRGLPPYLSLEDAILGARRMGAPPRLVAFWSDEGNFSCFDSVEATPDGEMPVEFWDHDSRGAMREAPDFLGWLTAAYRRLRGGPPH